MASSRDDIVITPSLDQVRASAPVRAREERRLSGAKSKRGILSRIAKARASQKLIRRGRVLRTAARRGAVSRFGVGGMVRGARAAASALNPIGAIVTASVVAAAVITRLASGQSFENMGQQVNNILLGDLDDEARAAIGTRKRLSGDSDIARIVGQEGGVNSQISSVFKDLKDLQKRDEVGASKLKSEKGMQVNGNLDILIIRAKNKFLEAWNGNGGDEAVEELRRKLHRPPAGAR